MNHVLKGMNLKQQTAFCFGAKNAQNQVFVSLKTTTKITCKNCENLCLARNIAKISFSLGILLCKELLTIALTDTYTDKNLILSVFRAKSKNCLLF